MRSAAEYTFDCSDCGARIEVNAAMRESLLEHDCVVCGASVSSGAFDRRGNI